MKLTLLGTSAGEGYPGLWCHCPNCEYARVHGGRNIRQNSCALLDEDIMLDLSSHAFFSAMRFNLDITRIQYLFVTHDHRDHFDSQHLIWRSSPTENSRNIVAKDSIDLEHALHQMGPRHTSLPMLEIFGHGSILEALRANTRFREDNMIDNYAMCFHELKGGEVIKRPNLQVTAVVSQHVRPGSVYNYIIERGGKTLLYALDCGGYDDDMLTIISAHRYDAVVLEGTCGHMIPEVSTHQNLQKNLRMLAFFNENHLWAGVPRMILSHLSPHWTPPYDVYVREMEQYGIDVAYDGMEVII